ncbi:hypothetical protein KJ608_03475, partial [Patescibacteria group bacterium]|nr:hypothetical protein [Patescibacteria group bacterium]
MIEEQKHPINKFISLITLFLCTAGIIFLIVTFIPSLSPSIVKFRRDNLLAAYAKPEKFRMPQPSSLPSHRLINYTDERLNDLINLLPSQTVTLTKFENCTLNVSTGAKINSSIIQNSTMNISGLNIHLENVILINTKITIDNNSIAKISNSIIQDNQDRIHVSRSQLVIVETLFINNNSKSLLYADGNASLTVKNSEFRSNDGIIFSSHNQKYIDLDGNESSLVPQFIIEHNLIEDNFHLPIYLADLDQFGTR